MWMKVLPGVLIACLLAACGAAPTTASAPPPPPPQPPLSTDMAWAQLTVALNERALQVLRLVPDRAGDERLQTFAAEVAAEHDDETAQLRDLLRRMGAPDTNPHEGHNMPGMSTPEQIEAMTQASGEPFDSLFFASMRDHLTQCHSLAISMRQAGDFPLVASIAAAIQDTRQRELDRLSGLA